MLQIKLAVPNLNVDLCCGSGRKQPKCSDCINGGCQTHTFKKSTHSPFNIVRDLMSSISLLKKRMQFVSSSIHRDL